MSAAPQGATRTTAAAGGRAARGALMFMASHAIFRALGFVSIAFLGRLLTPADFGVVALALVVVGFTEAVSSRQFDQALIRLPAPDAEDFATAFTLSALWGVTAALLVTVLAVPMAGMFEEPALADALRIMALVPLFDGLRNPRFVQFEKAMRFGRTISVDIVARVAMTAVTIGAAFWLRDFRAIVLGQVLFSGARMALTYIFAWRWPGFGLSRCRDFLRFGGWLTGEAVVEFGNRRIAVTLIGYGLDSRASGFFRMGEDLSTMATQQLAYPLKRVVLPGLAAVAGDAARLRSAYLTVQATILGVILPGGVGLALTAPEAIRILVGGQWVESAPVAQILAPAMAFSLVAAGTKALLLVDGDTRALFLRSLVMLAVTGPLIVGGYLWAGFLGVVVAQALATLIRSFLMLYLANRVVGATVGALLLRGWRSFAAAAAMSAAVLMLDSALALPAMDLEAAMVLLPAKAALGAAVYVATHAALWLWSGRPDGVERTVLRVTKQVVERLGRRPASPA